MRGRASPWALALVALCIGYSSNVAAFYLPGVAPHDYNPGEDMRVKVRNRKKWCARADVLWWQDAQWSMLRKALRSDEYGQVVPPLEFRGIHLPAYPVSCKGAACCYTRTLAQSMAFVSCDELTLKAFGGGCVRSLICDCLHHGRNPPNTHLRNDSRWRSR